MKYITKILTVAALISAVYATAAMAEPASRVLNEGTRITITAGDVVIPAILNDSVTSQDLISKLPYTMTSRRYSHDYCGVMPDPLVYNEEDVHYGWLNGDLAFARDSDYFVMFFADEENSSVYGHQITLGKINADLEVLRGLPSGSIQIIIALAE